MPVGFADEIASKDNVKQSSDHPAAPPAPPAKSSSAVVVDSDEDDFWSMFSKGLVSQDIDTEESTEEEEELPFGFYLNIQGLLAILNNALEELSLLKRIMNTPVDKTWDMTVKYKTLQERFQGSKQLVFEESEFDNLTDRQKLQKDICFIYNILRDGYNELVSNDTCESPVSAIRDMFQLIEDENYLFEEYRLNQLRIQKYKYSLFAEKKEHHLLINDRKYQFFALKDKYEDRLVYGKYNVKYINEWEGSRIQQNQLLRLNQEMEHIKTIQEHDLKMQYETRVHNEITLWLNTNTEDMNDAIQYWANHYEEERDRRDLEIYNLKTARDQLIEKLEDTKVLYQKHEKEMEEWIEYRDKKEAQERQEELEWKAAIKIQAWWRGVMVRNKLGPFRKKKKGKDKKGKKGGKKKKQNV